MSKADKKIDRGAMSAAPKDIRDGSMTGINGPMSPAQTEAYERASTNWTDIPLGQDYELIGAVHSAVVDSLKDRGVIETQWRQGVRQWRRT